MESYRELQRYVAIEGPGCSNCCSQAIILIANQNNSMVHQNTSSSCTKVLN